MKANILKRKPLEKQLAQLFMLPVYIYIYIYIYIYNAYIMYKLFHKNLNDKIGKIY